MIKNTAHRNASVRNHIGLVILLGMVIYALMAFSYANLRFDASWMEVDTMRLTRAIHFADADGTVRESRNIYRNGFSYQALGVSLVQVTGIPLQDLQRWGMFAINILFPIVAFATYRTLTDDNRVAVLAVMLLLIHPDFLFVLWRGSHEKITWMLALLIVFFIARSFKLGPHMGELGRNLTGLILVMLAFVFANTFFASTFITNLTLAYVGGVVVLWLRSRLFATSETERPIRQQVGRMLPVIIFLWVLLYLFIYYLYPPSQHLLVRFRSLIDGLSALFLRADDSVAGNAYAYITATWVDPAAFILVSFYSFLLLALALIIWWIGAARMLRRQPLTAEQGPGLLLWLLVGAAGLQMALSVFADLTNVLGSNLQVRLLPQFIVVSVALVAQAFWSMLDRLNSRFVRAMATLPVVFIIMGFSVLSLLKTTNEPTLSNNWLFVTGPELATTEWLVEQELQGPDTWIGDTSRLLLITLFQFPGIDINYTSQLDVQVGSFDHYVMTDVEAMRWQRLNRPLPDFTSEALIYDNGSAQIYSKRPRTPFQ